MGSLDACLLVDSGQDGFGFVFLMYKDQLKIIRPHIILALNFASLKFNGILIIDFFFRFNPHWRPDKCKIVPGMGSGDDKSVKGEFVKDGPKWAG